MDSVIKIDYKPTDQLSRNDLEVIGATKEIRVIPFEHDNSNSIYVKSTGSDETGDGSQENPYRTLEIAFNRKNANIKDGKENLIVLDSGEYELSSATKSFIIYTEFQSGSDYGFYNIYALQGETPTIKVTEDTTKSVGSSFTGVNVTSLNNTLNFNGATPVYNDDYGFGSFTEQTGKGKVASLYLETVSSNTIAYHKAELDLYFNEITDTIINLKTKKLNSTYSLLKRNRNFNEDIYLLEKEELSVTSWNIILYKYNNSGELQESIDITSIIGVDKYISTIQITEDDLIIVLTSRVTGAGTPTDPHVQHHIHTLINFSGTVLYTIPEQTEYTIIKFEKSGYPTLPTYCGVLSCYNASGITYKAIVIKNDSGTFSHIIREDTSGDGILTNTSGCNIETLNSESTYNRIVFTFVNVTTAKAKIISFYNFDDTEANGFKSLEYQNYWDVYKFFKIDKSGYIGVYVKMTSKFGSIPVGAYAFVEYSWHGGSISNPIEMGIDQTYRPESDFRSNNLMMIQIYPGGYFAARAPALNGEDSSLDWSRYSFFKMFKAMGISISSPSDNEIVFNGFNIIPADGKSFNFLIDRGEFLTFKNCTFEAPGDGDFITGFSSDTNLLDIINYKNCILKNAGNGISYRAFLERCIIQNIELNYAFYYLRFNYSDSNPQLLINHCTIYNCYGGIREYNPDFDNDYEIIKNSIIFGVKEFSILDAGNNCDLFYCCFEPNTLSGVIPLTGCIESDPFFVNYGEGNSEDTDLHLQTGSVDGDKQSPCINHGSDDLDLGVYNVVYIFLPPKWNTVVLPTPEKIDKKIKPINPVKYLMSDGTTVSDNDGYTEELNLFWSAVLSGFDKMIKDIYLHPGDVSLYENPVSKPNDYNIYNLIIDGELSQSASHRALDEYGSEGLTLKMVRNISNA